jgi:nucleotide-binding universal stress UspA family protein
MALRLGRICNRAFSKRAQPGGTPAIAAEFGPIRRLEAEEKMPGIETILVPTDGSEGAMKAAAFAGDIARSTAARVIVLTVQNEEEIIQYAWGAGDSPGEALYAQKSVEDIRNMLDNRVRNKELPNTVAALGELEQTPEAIVEWGHPVVEICRIASEREADLIVIGSHGRSGFARVILGSVSNAVASQAGCPVTIVR